MRIKDIENGLPIYHVDIKSFVTAALQNVKYLSPLVSTTKHGQLLANQFDDLIQHIRKAASSSDNMMAAPPKITLRNALIGIGMAFDAIEFYYTAKDMAAGSKSPLATRIREDTSSVCYMRSYVQWKI